MIAILDNILVTHRPNGGEGLEQEQHQTHKLSNKHSLQNMKKNPSLSRFLATEAYQESSKKPKKPPKKYKKNTKDNSKNNTKITPKINKLLVNFGTILGIKFAQKIAQSNHFFF